MSQVIFPFSAVTVPVAINDKIALFSEGSYQLSEVLGDPNYPATVNVFATVLSGALTTTAFQTTNNVTITSSGVFPVYYEVGTDAVVKAIRGQVYQGNPNALNATGALTAAMVLGGIVTSTTAAPTTGTLPTGVVMDAASSFSVGDAVDFSVINTGPSAFTVAAAASGHTVVGNMVVAGGTTGRFRTRKTGSNTFVTYTLANGPFLD